MLKQQQGCDFGPHFASCQGWHIAREELPCS